MVGVHRLGAVERLQPLARVRRSHRGEDAVQEDLAEEEDLLPRQLDARSPPVCARPRNRISIVLAAERQRLLVGDEHRVGRQLPAAAAATCAAASARSRIAFDVGWMM